MTWLDWLRSLWRPAPAPTPPPVPLPADVPAALLAAHNDARRGARLPPLAPSPALQTAAAGHSRQMAKVGRMGHQGVGDGDMTARLDAAGYRWSAAAENVGEGYPSVAAAVGGWLRSAPHRANILGPYRDFGGAMAAGRDGRLYWCTVFGTPDP